ncbi:MAG: hypothetical protein AAF677_06485 [Pseudomonadota bacterium]
MAPEPAAHRVTMPSGQDTPQDSGLERGLERELGGGLGGELGGRLGGGLERGLDSLCAGRVHEAVGPGRRAFAAAMAGLARGPVLWILDARAREAPYPAGLAPLLDPTRVILARPTGLIAALQVAEEALRSGACPFVIAELEQAPDLTQSRRLQLAAGTGGGRGLCLLPETRLATNAAETRWHCSPVCRIVGGLGRAARGGQGAGGDIAAALPLQHWELVKNKRGALGAWQVALRLPGWPAAGPQPASRVAPQAVPRAAPGAAGSGTVNRDPTGRGTVGRGTVGRDSGARDSEARSSETRDTVAGGSEAGGSEARDTLARGSEAGGSEARDTLAWGSEAGGTVGPRVAGSGTEAPSSSGTAAGAFHATPVARRADGG